MVRAGRLVRERVEAATKAFPRRRGVECPFPEHADAYGNNLRTKLERCFRVTDGEVERPLYRRKESRERAAEAIDGLDLLITPTLQFVAPPADSNELDILDDMIRFTYRFNVLGWPALALPCGRAERGLLASVQLIGHLGDDARVIAAGELLERTLASTI